MGLDKRIGPKFLHPGPGYGGSCFPKDTQALADIARNAGVPFEIVETVISVNERMKERAAGKVLEALGDHAEGAVVALLGLSFKPETDDVRESPAIPVVKRLIEGGVDLRVYDPAAMDNAREVLPDGLCYCENAYHAAEGADALIILTEWNQFRSLDLDRLKKAMKRPLVVDLRNVYEPAKLAERGFEYQCVGRAAADLPEG